MNIVITGANRGLGLGLLKIYAERGDTVFAGARNLAEANDLRALRERFPKLVFPHACDVSQDDSCKAFAKAVGQANIDVLINNAGMSGGGNTLDDLSFKVAHEAYEVNALAPLRVAQAFAHCFKRPGGKLVNITSLMGSIADNEQGGKYAYRMSKAALNMGSKTLAIEWQAAGITVAMLHPGWVKTRMGGAGAPLSIEQSTSGMVATIDTLTLAQTGAFLNYDGAPIAW